MSFIFSIEALRSAYQAYRLSSKFISATKSVIEIIGSNEFDAAIKSLNDMKLSNKPERELNMAITQFRTALQHFDSECNGWFPQTKTMKRRFQTALLISVCYYVAGEPSLSEKYRSLSVAHFSEWLEQKGKPLKSALTYKEEAYDDLKFEVNNLGLTWENSYPERSFFSWEWAPKAQNAFNELYRRDKDAAKKQFDNVTKSLIS